METICLNEYNDVLMNIERVVILKSTGNTSSFTKKVFPFYRNFFHNMVKLY